eukprot:2816264-Rhodomonas_salina.3
MKFVMVPAEAEGLFQVCHRQSERLLSYESYDHVWVTRSALRLELDGDVTEGVELTELSVPAVLPHRQSSTAPASHHRPAP